jgi:hypothetical protein
MWKMAFAKMAVGKIAAAHFVVPTEYATVQYESGGEHTWRAGSGDKSDTVINTSTDIAFSTFIGTIRDAFGSRSSSRRRATVGVAL